MAPIDSLSIHVTDIAHIFRIAARGLSSGAIIGIIMGSLATLAMIVVILCFSSIG
jgi:hypothetical protein